TWDRPASPCLASRFPYGSQITVESLKQVEKAERFLKKLGFEQLRVRHYGSLARIEVLPSDFSRIVIDETCRKIVSFFKLCGYNEITLDLEGFRTGRLNEALERLDF
ncbi:MAG TPA: TIGR00268 family protein, partial [Thermodesulfovibrionia bacterium]|nr:TIGR00268 family protein [Thermodesulfovibrionia bacterium]